MAPIHETSSKTILFPMAAKSKKIYIPIRVQTNAINTDDIAINAAYLSFEDLTDEQCHKKTPLSNRSKDAEVRYLDHIRSFKDKFKGVYSCSQKSCPMMKERLEGHQVEHHKDNPVHSDEEHQMEDLKTSLTQNQTKPTSSPQQDSKKIERRLSTAELKRISVGVIPNTVRSEIMENRSIQTLSKLKDFSHSADNNYSSYNVKSDHTTQSSEDSAVLSRNNKNQTTETESHATFRQNLENKIKEWFQDIPIYPNLTQSAQNLRKNMIQNFIDKINDIAKNDYFHENKIKSETGNFLNTLPMWYPGAKGEQDAYKDSIKNKLWMKIKDLRLKEDKANSTNLAENLSNMDGVTYFDDYNAFKTIDSIEKIIQNEILDWLKPIKLKKKVGFSSNANIREVADIFTKRLRPILNKPVNSRNHKIILRGVVIDTLNNLSDVLQYPKNERMYLNRLTEDLANRLLYIQFNNKSYDGSILPPNERNVYQIIVSSDSDVGLSLHSSNSKKWTKGENDSSREDTPDTVIHCLEAILGKGHAISDNEINSENFNKNITNTVLESVKDTLTNDIINKTGYSNYDKPCLSGILSVYTSEYDLTENSKYPITSTPKRFKKESSKLNPGETNYINNISGIISDWMNTLLKTLNDDKKYKETAVMDLAGEIMDQAKIAQLAPKQNLNKKEILFFIIYRWFNRFDLLESISADSPEIYDLMKRLDNVPIPDLTRPHHGTRHATNLMKHRVAVNESDVYLAKGRDILGDEISVWLNEQPSEIFVETDKDMRNKMVNEIAEKLENRLINKRPESEIKNDLSEWLKKMIVSSKRKSIDKLANDLKHKIIYLPQDETLHDNLLQELRMRTADQAICANIGSPSKCSSIKDAPAEVDIDNTLKEFIAKYMEHNYDVDDSFARGAFAELLKTEIRKLSPLTRKEVYDNFTKPSSQDGVSKERFDKELQYIKIVSDWLKNIPIDNSFNTPQNKERIDFVNDIAKNISEVEEERQKAPLAMDYDMYLGSIIGQLMHRLPISSEQKDYTKLMVNELVGKVIASRYSTACCRKNNQSLTLNDSSGIQEQNIGEFIENYIHLNAAEFADDPMKMDAWSARILKEVKKIAIGTSDPASLCKAQVYNKLTNVPTPGDESVKLFSLELDYAKEISDWLNNLPLLPISSTDAMEKRVKMISDLAEKFSERDKHNLSNPNETQVDSKITEYIKGWINHLPLDSKKEIIPTILIQQLLRRIEKAKKAKDENGGDSSHQMKINDSTSTQKKIKKSPSKTSKHKLSCKPRCRGCKMGQSGQLVVDSIETWSNNLPIQGENKDEENNIKATVARKLYQKVGNLMDDPETINDNDLFQDLLSDDIDAQLDSLSPYKEIQEKKESLKTDLINKIMEAKCIIAENTAGENYKQKLEQTIDASIPNPVTNKQWYDPGFEIYKNRLAEMFILDNFDHSDDAIKARYEVRIRRAVDKYFQNAVKRNATKLTKDEIYNELYSTLFKVPIPNEMSTIEEVEEIKTRCEIDTWFENLPVREALGVNELYDWDEILSTLAKRLHEIEKNEPNQDQKMHKEIKKWLHKLPLLPDQERNIERFANDLQNRLKITKEDRKCVIASSICQKSKKGKTLFKPSKPKENLDVVRFSQSGPSHKEQMWYSPQGKQQVCCPQEKSPPRKRPGELIVDIVQNWCSQLPLPAITPKDEENNAITRGNIGTKILLKLSELYDSPQVFQDNILFNYLLDEELEHLFSQLPLCCDFHQSKDTKKIQLKEALNTIKPLIIEDRARFAYKEELKNTICNVLKEPANTTANKMAIYNEIQNDIVDSFMQYVYHINDDESKLIYKTKLKDVVRRFYLDLQDNPDKHPVDPLIRQNQLLCELTKVPKPGQNAIRDEVEEIRMKDEVKEFFHKLDLSKETEDEKKIRESLQKSLAKHLNEIERTGHNCANDAQMKKEINRCLNKLNKNVSPDKIDAFVNKLKANEHVRKSTPPGENINQYEQGFGSATQNNIPTRSLNEFAVNTRSNIGVTPVEYPGFGSAVDVGSLPLKQMQLSSQHHPVDYQMPANISQLNNIASVPLSSRPASSVPNGTGNTGVQFAAELIPSMAKEDVQRSEPVRFNTGFEEPGQRLRGRTGGELHGTECKCGGTKRKMKVRPRCVLRMPYSCDECEDFGPMWMPMPYPFPPGYPYF